jgi:hypothetical protein
MKKLESGGYNDVKSLFYDFYGHKWYCSLKFEMMINRDFQKHVSDVDFDKNTKDLPAAHFDAEAFIESNQRVMDFMYKIYHHISVKKYERARELSGQILHTIHDFYSHSNWIEMGNLHQINKKIGTKEFVDESLADSQDNVTCVSNCTLMETKCSTVTTVMFKFLKSVGFKSPTFTCKSLIGLKLIIFENFLSFHFVLKIIMSYFYNKKVL